MKKQSDSVSVFLADLPVSGTIVGKLVGFAPSGEPLVDPSGDNAPRGVRARTCVALGMNDLGRTVVLVFESGNPDCPIVLGVLQATRREQDTQVDVDGKTIVVTAQETIVLRCGEASITLNRDGKVVIRGQHVVTHASGVNRIRGGSVQLN